MDLVFAASLSFWSLWFFSPSPTLTFGLKVSFQHPGGPHASEPPHWLVLTVVDLPTFGCCSRVGGTDCWMREAVQAWTHACVCGDAVDFAAADGLLFSLFIV